MLLFDSEEVIAILECDFAKAAKIPEQEGIIVTAKGIEVDFVSRYFAPKIGIPEDPVTGSAHTVLAPYWASVLQKDIMSARQLSKRGGSLGIRICGERVFISGRAITYAICELMV